MLEKQRDLRKLAAKMGIPYQQISQYERGLVEPKFKTVCKIADAINCIPLQQTADDSFYAEDFAKRNGLKKFF